jgi:hypothetical protein
MDRDSVDDVVEPKTPQPVMGDEPVERGEQPTLDELTDDADEPPALKV